MKTKIWTVSTNCYDNPVTYCFDTFYGAENFLAECNNGEIELYEYEHDEPLNYSEGCTFNELTFAISGKFQDVTKRYHVARQNGCSYYVPYDYVCYTLGINPDVHFVKITNRGTITFTCGKPDEVRDLLREVRKAGYVPAKKLVEAAN